MDDPTKESIAEEFPDWEAWQGTERLWHARIRGATPPVMVWGEDLLDLRDEMIKKIRTLRIEAEQRRIWPEEATT